MNFMLYSFFASSYENWIGSNIIKFILCSLYSFSSYVLVVLSVTLAYLFKLQSGLEKEEKDVGN